MVLEIYYLYFTLKSGILLWYEKAWVILNCAEKLLIFILDLCSKTLSDIAAVLNLERKGHAATVEDYAKPLTDPAEICVYIIVPSQCSCDSLFISREHGAMRALTALVPDLIGADASCLTPITIYLNPFITAASFV